MEFVSFADCGRDAGRRPAQFSRRGFLFLRAVGLAGAVPQAGTRAGRRPRPEWMAHRHGPKTMVANRRFVARVTGGKV